MLIKHILQNILLYFLPLAVPSTVGLLAIEVVRKRWKLVAFGNAVVLMLVVFYSVLTRPAHIPLQVEWAFYAMHEKPDSTYDLWTLLGEGEPTFLGLEDQLGEIKGLPIVHTGDHSQMRIRLNRKGYIYVFHFDTTFSQVRQLLPSDDVQLSNPVPSDSWIELPSSSATWKLDPNPGIEVFLAYVSSKESYDIGEEVERIVEEARKGSVRSAAVLKNVQQRLKALGPCNPTISGEVAHNLTGVTPPKVRTYAYRAEDGRTALLCQFVRHEP